jgi:hypothetical protein
VISLAYRHGRGWACRCDCDCGYSTPAEVATAREALSPGTPTSALKSWRAVSDLRRRFPRRDIYIQFDARGWIVAVYRWDAPDHEAVAIRSGVRRTLRDAVRAVVRMRAEERKQGRRKR